MRYQELIVTNLDIDQWWIIHKQVSIISVNNKYRPKFKMKLSRKAKK